MQILTDLGCVVEADPDGEEDHVLVTPPSWRPDLVDAPDYAEEVARIDGYNRIPSVVPALSGGQGLTHAQKTRRLVANVLAGAGYYEWPGDPAALFEARDRRLIALKQAMREIGTMAGLERGA